MIFVFCVYYFRDWTAGRNLEGAEVILARVLVYYGFSILAFLWYGMVVCNGGIYSASPLVFTPSPSGLLFLFLFLSSLLSSRSLFSLLSYPSSSLLSIALYSSLLVYSTAVLYPLLPLHSSSPAQLACTPEQQTTPRQLDNTICSISPASTAISIHLTPPRDQHGRCSVRWSSRSSSIIRLLSRSQLLLCPSPWLLCLCRIRLCLPPE